MLIPRFSLRWLLAATAVCGVLAYVLSQAVMGQAWGIAVSVACGALLLTARCPCGGIRIGVERGVARSRTSPIAGDIAVCHACHTAAAPAAARPGMTNEESRGPSKS